MTEPDGRSITSAHTHLILAGILAITAAVFLPLLGFDFNAATDDYHFILKNPTIKKISVDGLLDVLSARTPRFNEYYPLPFLSYWMDNALFGMVPAGFFFTQILLHLINVWLVYRLVMLLGQTDSVAMLTSLIFAIHPLQVDTLAMINQRENLLNTLFGLLSLASYAKWRVSRSAGALVASLVGFSLSLLCDAPWVVLPMLLFCIDYIMDGHVSMDLVPVKVPFFVLSAILSMMTIVSNASSGMITSYHFGTSYGQAVLVVQLYADYLRSFLIPIGLSPGYTYNPDDILSLTTLLAVLLAVSVVAAGVVAWKRGYRVVVFGIAWYSFCFLPFSQIIPIMIVRSDQFMYHTLIGPAMIVAAGVVALVGSEQAARRSMVLVALAVGCLAPLTLSQLRHYSSAQSYIDRFVQTQGWAPSSEVLLARAYQHAGDKSAEAECLKRVAPHFPEPISSKTRLRLAVIYMELGDPQASLEQLSLIDAVGPVARDAENIRRKILESAPDSDNLPRVR